MRDQLIKRNVILFFVFGAACLLSMLIVSKADLDNYTKLISTVSIVCASFFVGLYFIGRIFYLCFKKS